MHAIDRVKVNATKLKLFIAWRPAAGELPERLEKDRRRDHPIIPGKDLFS